MPAGPRPKTAAELHARGSPLAKTRRGNVSYPVKAPACPSWLGKEAKAEWRRVVALLIKARSVASIDRALLSLYCESWGDYVSMKSDIRKLTWVKAVKLGLVAATNKALANAVKIADRFGFSPLARERVKPSPDGPGDGPKLSLGTL